MSRIKLSLVLSLLMVLSCSFQAKAQGVSVTGIALANGGYYAKIVPSAVITVCAANNTQIPCSPALSSALFSNFALTVPLTNPFNSDANGNYNFFAAPGNYTITVTGVGVTGYSQQISLIGPSVGTANTWTAVQSFSATIQTGSIIPIYGGVLGNTTFPFTTVTIGAPGATTFLQTVATANRFATFPDISGLVQINNGSGVTALSTGALGGAGCETTITVSAAAATTSSKIVWSYSTDPSAVAGYGSAPIDAIHLLVWPTLGNVNFKQCSSVAVTPGAISIQWDVLN